MAIYQKVNMSFDYTLAERTLIAAHSFWFYVWKLLWPAHLALLYARWDIDVMDALAWGTVVAAVGVFTALWFLRHRIGRGPLACALFFALTLSPVLGFVDYGYMNVSFVADRYQYLAGIGVLTLLIGGAAWGVDKLPGAAKMAMAGVAGAVLLLLGAATWIQSSVYQDDLTLFSHSAAINPESWAAHHYAGKEFFKQRRDREAEHHFRRSLELRPRDEDSRQHRNALQNIGETQRRRGQYEEALESYRAALEIDPPIRPGPCRHGRRPVRAPPIRGGGHRPGTVAFSGARRALDGIGSCLPGTGVAGARPAPGGGDPLCPRHGTRPEPPGRGGSSGRVTIPSEALPAGA